MAAGFEFPEGFRDVSGGAFEGDGGDAGWFLAVEFGEVWFVVEGVDVGDGAWAVDDEDSFGGCLEMRGARGVWVVGIDGGADGGFSGEVGGVVFCE